jgi:hypothetical protein
MNSSKCMEIVKNIVSRHRFGELICEGGDYKMLLYVFKFHPRFIEKTRGLNIKCFSIEPSPLGKGFILYAILSDGSRADWSYIKACSAMGSGTESIRRIEVFQAFRLAIEDQVGEFIRSKTINGMVLADDGNLYDRDEVEVHHQGKSFNDLVNEFLKLKGLELGGVKTIDIGIGRDFADPQLKSDWVEFHSRYAKLSIVPKSVHRKVHKMM